MGIRVNNNTPSLFAQRQHSKNRTGLNKAFERLSSGLRINKAADDAAGLAISSRFESQIRGLNQAVRNASDGVSMAQTADAALGSVNENLQRIRELSVQAGNGILTSSDREAIQSEISQLSDEIGRVSETTSFNGRDLLQGGGGVSLQVGASANETITVPTGDSRSENLGTAARVEGQAIDAAGIEAGELVINGVEIRETVAVDDSASTAQNTGSAIAVANAINSSSDSTGVTARANATEVEGAAIQGGALDSNNSLSINGVTITSVNVEAGDAGDSLVDAINAEVEQTGVMASRDAGGELVLEAQDGRNVEVEVTGNAGDVTGLSSGVTTGTVTLESQDNIVVSGTAPTDAGFQAGTTGADRTMSVDTIDVRTVAGANDAISTVDRAIEQVGRMRSSIGASQNRLEATISNLSNVSENVQSSNSRIADADFAKEAAEMIRRRILEQANVSMMGQANVSKQSALKLLGG